MQKTILLLTTGVLLLCLSLPAQQPTSSNNVSNYFNEAYALYPGLPKGILEATAFSASHMDNLHAGENEPSNCLGMPLQFGLFGLFEDGKGYFKNSMAEVCALSNITTSQFKKDVRLQVLAVAKYLSQQAPAARTVEDFAGTLENLSAIPEDGSNVNTFARKSYSYDIYRHLQKGVNTPAFKLNPVHIQLKKIYPEATLHALQAPGIELNFDKDRVRTPGGANITPTSNTASGSITANSVLSADYPPAIWNAAASCNYNNGRSAGITHVAIHTTEGGYANTISWFKNCNASVSAHYVVRSSDGQVTQMVAESNTAWHIANHNSYTVGIEHEAFAGQASWFTENLYQSSAALTRDICASHGIDVNTCFRGPGSNVTNPQPASYRIKGHQHFPISNGKWDPGPHWNWPKYADLLRPYIIIPNGTYRIANAGSGKVLDAVGCSGNNGTLLNIWDWWGGDCQRWLFEHTGDGWYKITCRLGGRTIDNDKCLLNDGNKLQLWDWLDNNCQRWRIEDWGGGQVRLVNSASGKLLDCVNGGTANGTQVWQWSYNGTNAQRWFLQPVSSNYIADGAYRIRLARNNKVLQPSGGNDNPGTAMSMWDWVDSSYQRWTFENTADGWYKITSPNGFALDVENCNTLDGGKVMLWDWLNNDCQRWSLTAAGNGLWNISSKASVKALDAPGTDNGSVVYQWTWLNNGNQQWFIEAPPPAMARKTLVNRPFTLAPNPVTAGDEMQMMYNSEVSQPATITITDLFGRIVQQRTVSVHKGINRFVLPTALLQPGMYNATIQHNSTRRSKKIMVR